MAADRESMLFDVVIVGAGPSGLSSAIRLKQLAAQNNHEINVCIVEKGSEVGAHILSGAVLDPKSLNELIPDWQEKDAPITRSVVKDRLIMLTKKWAFKLPVPPSMHNKGSYIISLGLLTRWLAEQAESMGVEIYPGFAASEVLYHEDGSVKGIATGDMGIGKEGEPTNSYQQGMELHAHQTIFAEGCRGSLSKTIIEKFDLDKDSDKQTYGLGIKEIWEVDPSVSKPGTVIHTVGWPMDSATYGGSFIYHLDNNQVAIGMVVGLDYKNPYLSPFEEFQRLKTHPKLAPLFKNGQRIAYGARALVEGGIQSLPKLTFPGGLLVGDAAGFLNVPRIKGIHTVMKSGMIAAESVFEVLCNVKDEKTGLEILDYTKQVKNSWLHKELWGIRNVRPAFKWGMYVAFAYAALEDYIFKGHVPWTFKHKHSDHEALKKAKECQKIDYPKPDGVITFDRLSSVFLSATNHEEDQPAHLKLKDPSIAISVNAAEYDSPETRYCPAGVYEIIEREGNIQLQINAQNCVHCKTCDIKDPTQNIVWTCPEGGGGPNYTAM